MNQVNQSYNYYPADDYIPAGQESDEPQEAADEAAEDDSDRFDGLGVQGTETNATQTGSDDENLTPLEQALSKYGYEMLVYDGDYGLEKVEDVSDWEWLLELANSECLYGVTDENEMETLSYETAENIIREAELIALRQSTTEDTETTVEEETEAEVEHKFMMEWGVLSPYRFSDDFFEWELEYADFQSQQGMMLFLCIGTGVVALVGTIWLCCASGWRKDQETVTVYGFHKWWLDVLLVLYILGMCICGGAVYIVTYSYLSVWKMNVLALICAGAALLTLPMLCTIVVRMRTHTVVQNTACYHIVTWAWKRASDPVKSLNLADRAKGLWGMAHRNISLALRVAVLYVIYCLLTWWVLNPRTTSFGSVLWLIVHMLLFCVVEGWTLDFWNIRKGVEEIASGNVDYKIATEKMPADLRQLSVELNRISDGVAIAVDERMKSEHFKAELITNVSHDLKTPLTSIINYIDLLKKENVENPTAREYIEVLDRKSQRLKKLTEDLVDASKASTGAMPTNLEPLNMNQLVNQALGEYDEKLEGKRLTPVVSLPEEAVTVLADGRHLWRVMDNLLGNCVKYAMPGTRIYLSVQIRESEAVLIMKNISEQPLNLTEEELMERFVRGDSSRTTEGSGLGLSIARSLMDLQKGDFRIEVDGDLFKAIVTVPLYSQDEAE
jgi:signal transduction histidine kinase